MSTSKTDFSPQAHGHTFRNGASSLFGELGVCGGMAWTALDYFYHPDVLMPGYPEDAFPNRELIRGWAFGPNEHFLSDYVWARQHESAWANGARFLGALTVPPNVATEFRRVKDLIDAGQPAPIALPGLTAWIGDGHHVVGCAYREVNGAREILVYDPNYPVHSSDPSYDRSHPHCLLAIEKDDLVREFSCALDWQRGSERARWKGFFVADGYSPQSPPANMEDVFLSSAIDCPTSVASGQNFEVRFAIGNTGEFDCLVSSVCLGVDQSLLNQEVDLPKGRLPIGQTYSVSFTLSLPSAGWHTVEARFKRDKGALSHPIELGASRRILATASAPTGSYVSIQPLRPGGIVTPVLGRLLSPTSPFGLPLPDGPRTYEVTKWNIQARARVEDMFGGGTFSGNVSRAIWSIDGVALQIDQQTLNADSADLVGSFPPISKATSVLRVALHDAQGRIYDGTVRISCGDRYMERPRPLPHNILVGGIPGGPARTPMPRRFPPRRG